MSFEIRIRANKTGPTPNFAAGERWPHEGVEISEIPETFTLSTRLMMRGLTEGWIVPKNLSAVERPSQADPIVLEDGTIAPSPIHLMSKGMVGDPVPHRFLHIDEITLATMNKGLLQFKVIHQPDKYADNSTISRGYIEDPGTYTNDTQVTLEMYEAGHTRVDNFYELEYIGVATDV